MAFCRVARCACSPGGGSAGAKTTSLIVSTENDIVLPTTEPIFFSAKFSTCPRGEPAHAPNVRFASMSVIASCAVIHNCGRRSHGFA